MPMHQKGLTKLLEELAELGQIAAKKSAYIDTDTHPDGAGLMSTRLEEEMGDVLASIYFVSGKLSLDTLVISKRAEKKLKVFEEWDQEN